MLAIFKEKHEGDSEEGFPSTFLSPQGEDPGDLKMEVLLQGASKGMCKETYDGDLCKGLMKRTFKGDL